MIDLSAMRRVFLSMRNPHPSAKHPGPTTAPWCITFDGEPASVVTNGHVLLLARGDSPFDTAPRDVEQQLLPVIKGHQPKVRFEASAAYLHSLFRDAVAAAPPLCSSCDGRGAVEIYGDDSEFPEAASCDKCDGQPSHLVLARVNDGFFNARAHLPFVELVQHELGCSWGQNIFAAEASSAGALQNAEFLLLLMPMRASTLNPADRDAAPSLRFTQSAVFA